MQRIALSIVLTAALAGVAGAAPLGAHQFGATPQVSGNLTYRGGPVLQNVKVVTVYWGKNVQFSGATGMQTFDAFYGAVTNSAYFDMLQEYNTTSPVQKFGRGSWIARYAYTAGATGTVQDSAIHTALASLIDAGSVPAPDADTLYAIHFAPNITIQMSDGSTSCQVFCAYHNSFAHNGKTVFYSVNPDQGGSCAGGCGGDPSPFNNATSVASHELSEATTDADVGQNNLAWYDDSQGENGDICNASQCKLTGPAGGLTTCPTSYIVQNVWSNEKNACISQNPAYTPTNDFSMAVSPSTTIDVPAGGMATAMVTLTKTAGTSDTVNFTASSLPMDVTATFNPTSAMSAGGTTTVTFAASASATPGTAQSVTVKGAGAGGESHTATLMVQVVAPPDMAMLPDLAQPNSGGGGTGGNGGGAGGNGGGTGTGGNGNNGNGRGGSDSGCSIGGGSIAGSWALAAVFLLALALRRRRA